MARTQGVRTALFAGLVAIGFISGAMAQTSTPATGLGQAWPNAADVSANPHWHVYVFALNGVKYIQVNDLNGTVHTAVGTANGTTIVLPVGIDSQNVTTTGNVTSSAAQVIYHDATTTVTAKPQSNGTTSFGVTNLGQSCPQADCSGPGFAKQVP